MIDLDHAAIPLSIPYECFFSTLLVLTFLVPLWLTMVGLGVIFGQAMPSESAEAILGVVLFGVSFFGGAMSGAMGGAKQLAWESYRTFPVRIRSIFAAELIASAIDLVPIVLGLSALGLIVGIAVVQRPSFWLVPLAFAEAIVVLLVLQLIVGTLASQIVQRLRFALTALGLAVWAGATLAASAPEARSADPNALERASGLLRVVASLGKAAGALPTTRVVRSFSLSAQHRYLEALSQHAYAVLLVALLAVIAGRMVAREMASGAGNDVGGARLWSFGSAARGIARLQFTTILQSRVGRFGLVVPILVLVLVRGPLQAFAGQSAWTVPGAYAYLSLVANQFQLNQFGLDGHGVKALLLLPVSERDILSGKAWGLFVYQSIAAVLLTVLLAFVQHAHLEQLVAGMALFLAIVLVQNAVGRRTSVTMPRMTPRKDVRANATPIGLVLVGLVVSVVGGSFMSSAYVALERYASRWLVPGMVGLAFLAAAMHRASRGSAERLFRAKRETLLAALG